VPPTAAPTATPQPALAADLAEAANRFLATLDEGRRAQATYAFSDEAERTRWHWTTPRGFPRNGLPLNALQAEQHDAALALLEAGLSPAGMQKSLDIMSLQVDLGNDPELYYVTVFGTPGGNEPWGWRFEGHHLSVNVTELGPHGPIVAPLFMGANPARVPSGPREGHRLLAAEEDLAFELLQMLDPQQRARATIAEQTFGDIVTRSDPTVRPMAFVGLPATEMTIAQQRQLRRLLEVYAGRMADSSASRQLHRVEDAGFGRLHFAWAGAHQPGTPHYYRIHGPTVLVEYDNTQGSANHIHTVWRDLENDFGGDLLRKHYAQQPHGH
jgi:hypothetical protein